MKVKIFTNAATSKTLTALEAEINAWLQSGVQVVSMTQSGDDGDITITFLYN